MSSTFLTIQNITKHFGSKQALKGVSFEINKGEIFGLLGPNGAGKTTLSSIIAALHPPTSGDLLFEGKSIYQNISEYRLNLGFCPQHPNLNNALTLKENLVFSGRFYGMTEKAIQHKLDELISFFNLSEYLDQHSHVLSGGYRQRFMIARSLMHSPTLLLLDEPTVGMDPHIRRQLWETIKMLKALNVTIILTTHYLDEAESLSDRVCILDQGQIKLIDSPENLKNDFKQKNLEEVFIALMNPNKE
jgi:ABC-2 type transport system ATP-binding protein